MRANRLEDVLNLTELTIGDALLLKRIFGLSDDEAIAIFLGGNECENIPA